MASPRTHNYGRWGILSIGLALLAGCGETTANAPLPVARVAAVGAAGLTGVVGQPLPNQVEVQAFGSDDQPLPGAELAFSAGNGGSVDPASATTDANGVARTRWTLGRTVGANTLTVTAGSFTSTITATAAAGPPTSVTLVAGDNQTAAANSAVTTAPSVRVVDGFGNVAAGVSVTFSVLSGGGQVTGALRQTNAQGVATVGSWVLGPAAGTQTLAARVEASGVANNPIIFTATATPRTGSQMTISAGNNQRAPVGRLVAIAPTVVVADAAGAGVPGVVVTFAVATGGGNVLGARQTTDATGAASVGGWFLGGTPGTNTLTASATGLQTVTFTATAEAGVPTSMVAISPTTQSAPANTNVASPPSVVVRDVSGSPVAGVAVTFAVTAGAGTVVGSPATTNASGVATLTSWKLGTALGANTVVASATSLPPVTFNATATAGAPTAVIVNSGDNQAAIQGTAVALPPTVKVTDAGGNPVAGVSVTFAVVLGGGTAIGLNQTSDALGLASVAGWTLGTGAPNTLRATVAGTGITGNPVTFTAQSATQIGLVSPPAGPITLGTQFTINVQLQNSAAAAVSVGGIPLTIAIGSGGGTLNGTLSRTTAANGSVSFTGLSVTGVAGPRTLTITGAGLLAVTSASITFN